MAACRSPEMTSQNTQGGLWDDSSMSDSPVNLSTGLPETVLPPAPQSGLDELHAALELPENERREAVSAVVARYPTFLHAWARLAEIARDDVEGYAYARVGYHRGLDALRKAGWR